LHAHLDNAAAEAVALEELVERQRRHGRTVLGESEAPSDMPMIRECTTTPSSST
jgi:hypothetical protein